jgi:hypothetical protein
MSKDCGCDKVQVSSYAGTPSLDPPPLSDSTGDNAMSDQKPTLTPLAEEVFTNAAGDATPTLTPGTLASQEGGVMTWLNDKRVSALWSINQNRNSWVYITGVGWKRLATNSDSAVVALTMLAAHAKQKQTPYNYREEADGLIHETYVW